MNKPVYLGLSILEISKIVMYEFWYDYVKPKYRKKKQNYVTWMQTVLLSLDDTSKEIAEDVETRFDTSNIN